MKINMYFNFKSGAYFKYILLINNTKFFWNNAGCISSFINNQHKILKNKSYRKTIRNIIKIKQLLTEI